jgi:hypothetical protein
MTSKKDIRVLKAKEASFKNIWPLLQKTSKKFLRLKLELIEYLFQHCYLS